MLNFASSIYDWFVNSLGWIWLAIFFGAVAFEIFWKYVVVIRAWDIRYDPERQDKLTSGRLRRKPIRLNLARVRRVSVPYYAVPMFVLWAVALTLLIREPSWTLYLGVATLCFLVSPLREVWLIGVARRIKAKNDKELGKSFLEAIKGYYSEGLKLPEHKQPEPWFEDRLAFLNFFQRFHYVFHIFRFWGALVTALECLVWPVTLLVVLFHDLDEVDAYDERTPWWRLNRNVRTF